MAFLEANWLPILLGIAVVGLGAYIVKTKTDAAASTGTTPPATLKDSVALKADALKADVVTVITGLGMDVKNVEGDFGAATALFLNRALSHGVAKIVKPADKDTAEKLYADAALLIAASGPTAPTPAA